MGTLKFFDNAYKFFVFHEMLVYHNGAIDNATSNYTAQFGSDFSPYIVAKDTSGADRGLWGSARIYYDVFGRDVAIKASSESEADYSTSKYTMVEVGTVGFTGYLTTSSNEITKTYTVTITNSGDNDIEVNSLFGKWHGYGRPNATSTSYGTYDFIVWAYYFDNTITIAVGESAVIAFSVKMPMTIPTE